MGKHCLIKALFDEAHLRKRGRGDPCSRIGTGQRAVKHFRICHKIATDIENGTSRN